MIKIVSWNVNGLRSILTKGFVETIQILAPDILCLQEIKVSSDRIPEFELTGYEKFYNSAERKGYSGTAIFTKKKPIQVTTSAEIEILTAQHEGRIICLEYETFYLVNVYTPNSGSELARLEFREAQWDVKFAHFLKNLAQKKSVIACGDFNVAHQEIDLANPAQNRFNAGFTDQERNGFSNILDIGFIDSFRFKQPDERDRYTWWSYRANSRARNVGWRIDYILISENLVENLISVDIHQEILGSDHAPISAIFNL